MLIEIEELTIKMALEGECLLDSPGCFLDLIERRALLKIIMLALVLFS